MALYEMSSKTPGQVEATPRSSEWLTVEQVASELSVHRNTVYNWIGSKELRASNLGNKAGHRIRTAWLIDFLLSRSNRKAKSA